MAFTRELYSSCLTDKRAEESTGVLSYLMDLNKFYNCNPCRIERGTVGGNTVSLYEGNIVDLESDLMGRTRHYTRCPTGKYVAGTVVQGKDANKCTPECGVDGLPCGRPQCRQEKLVHLPECKLVHYKARPTDAGIKLNDFNTCPASTKKRKPAPGAGTKTRKNPYMPIEWIG